MDKNKSYEQKKEAIERLALRIRRSNPNKNYEDSKKLAVKAMIRHDSKNRR